MAVYCSRCGSENPDDSKFCYHCGARFAERIIPPERVQPIQDVEPKNGGEESADVNRDEMSSRVEEPTGSQPPQPKKEVESAVQAGRDSSFEFPAYDAHSLQYRQSHQTKLRYTPASFGIRVAAFIIDFVILSFITQIGIMMADFEMRTLSNDPSNMSRFVDEYLNFLVTGKMGDFLSQYMESFFLIAVLQLVLVFTYYFVFHAICGQTPGKFALGIKVTRTDGSPVGFWRSLFRYVVYWLGARFIYIGSFWALFNTQVATWHDLACDTRVYRVSSLESEEPEHI
jgi:uncharacterized RDD family membrane protein YckC